MWRARWRRDWQRRLWCCGARSHDIDPGRLWWPQAHWRYRVSKTQIWRMHLVCGAHGTRRGIRARWAVGKRSNRWSNGWCAGGFGLHVHFAWSNGWCAGGMAHEPNPRCCVLLFICEILLRSAAEFVFKKEKEIREVSPKSLPRPTRHRTYTMVMVMVIFSALVRSHQSTSPVASASCVPRVDNEYTRSAVPQNVISKHGAILIVGRRPATSPLSHSVPQSKPSSCPLRPPSAATAAVTAAAAAAATTITHAARVQQYLISVL